MNTENNRLLELENILSFLGILFIDYKGHRTSNGHETAKTIGEIKEFFGKEVMTSGQFIKDINWWDFKNNWNDLMFLVEKISEIIQDYHDRVFEGSDELENFYDLGLKNIKYSEDEVIISISKEFVYEDAISFIEWYNNQQKS